MDDDRLPKVVYNWDKSLNTEAWAKSSEFILQYVNMLEDCMEDDICMLKYVDLDVLKSRLMKLNREKWWLSTADMPKLRTFRVIYNEQDHMGIVYTNLTRRQRSLLVKFKTGILPLGLEVGRFVNKPIEHRLCLTCEEGLLDDEFHFLLYCDALKDIRSKYFAGRNYLEDVEDPTDRVELCKLMFTSNNLKHMGRFMEEMFDRRLKLLYSKAEEEEEVTT